MKKKVVIIGANSFQNPLIEKAKKMGYETHVFAWKCGDIGEKTADFFYPISIIEKEQILEVCKNIKPCAVCSIGSDLANITVQYVAKRLGLPCNSDRCIKVSTNKYEMRKALAEFGVLTPHFLKISDVRDLERVRDFSFPVIVKPTDRSGSRGINKVEQFEDLQDAFYNSVESSFSGEVIIEEYLEGEEYSCESITYNGKHNILAITKKYTTGAPHYIETGHIQPSGINEENLEAIKIQVKQALDALEITMGASHAEFKLDVYGKVKIIEIGSRMGGDCIGSHLVCLSTGNDFVEMVLDCAVGNEPKINKHPINCVAGIKFLFDMKDIEELEDLKQKRVELIKDISEISMPDVQTNVTDSSTRLGYYIVSGSKWDEINSIVNVK